MFQECHFIFSIQEFIVFSHVDNNPSGCVKQPIKKANPEVRLLRVREKRHYSS